MEWPWQQSRRDLGTKATIGCEECDRLESQLLESESELQSCKSALAEAEMKNAALESTADTLRAETERLLADLVVARLSKGGRSAVEDEKFRRLARTVQKFLHPDRAGQDQVDRSRWRAPGVPGWRHCSR
jgi:hypothetical protein